MNNSYRKAILKGLIVSGVTVALLGPCGAVLNRDRVATPKTVGWDYYAEPNASQPNGIEIVYEPADKVPAGSMKCQGSPPTTWVDDEDGVVHPC
jgi:hypothetical protein